MMARAFLLGLLLPLMAHGGTTEVSSKLTLRTGFGSFQNAGSNGGGTSGMGGFDLQYLHFLTPHLAVGLGYGAQFDTPNGGIPLGGYEIIGRVYPWHEGTRVTHHGPWGSAESMATWSPYILGQYSLRSFYLGRDFQSDDQTKSLSGQYTAINLGAGLDYNLDRRFGLNVEYSTSLVTFSSTDPRVRIVENIFWIGLNYVFE